MSMTRADARDVCYELFGEYLGEVFSGSITAGTLLLSSAPFFGKTRLGTNSLGGRIIYIPSAANAADMEKLAGNVDPPNQRLEVDDDVNYVATFTNARMELLARGVTPDLLNAAVQRALRSVYFKSYYPVTLWDDGDCEANDVNSWVVTADCALEPSTDEDDNLYGVRAKKATYNAADQYFRPSVALRLAPNAQVYLAANLIIRSGGPAYFDVYDNNTTLIERIEVNGYEPVHVGKTYTVPSSGLVTMRLGAANGSVVSYMDFPSHRIAQTYWKTPSFLDANHKLISLDEMEYFASANSQNYVQTIASRHPVAANRDVDYAPENHEEDSAPNGIQILHSGKWDKGLPANDLFYHVQRRESDRSALTDEDMVTNVDRDMFQHALIVEVGKMLNIIEGGQAWEPVIQEHQAKLDAQRIVRKVVKAAGRPQMMWMGR